MVGIDDAHVDQPPCQGGPILHALPPQSVVAAQLIDCVHLTSVQVVVMDHLGLSDRDLSTVAARLVEGDDGVDVSMVTE
jgi:hypothetical protein